MLRKKVKGEKRVLPSLACLSDVSSGLSSECSRNTSYFRRFCLSPERRFCFPGPYPTSQHLVLWPMAVKQGNGTETRFAFGWQLGLLKNAEALPPHSSVLPHHLVSGLHFHWKRERNERK